ncbi:ribonucleotide reductase of class III (anaerobic) large subunit [Providencia phage vB_PreS_PR1]|uniref:Ribonucleotide reductase of class III (Anaerobic) large subunit n=1 Tax=Providencia phage vB_PreS_PR1 TaxID=1931407 RepID=A0A1S6KUW4_9CAUD|nr:NrdD-like anaerobic ribonucleotide reductase large subunit [Providencia phage vB_PreS_PR1]AQT25209.1 ribonucleotide reductase of class III (anaerobic) large subunit [Providencia phage vB_PreS_PR1]
MNDKLKKMLENVRGILSSSASDELLFNNANKPSERFPTQRDMIAGEVSKYLLYEMLPQNIWNAHERGEIHFHDADYSAMGMTNCCLVDLEGMLKDGLRVGNANIETPKSIGTAVAITAQIIAQVSSHQYGGTSIDRFDEVLATYVRKSYDKNHAFARRWTKDEAKASVMATEMTEKNVEDAMQGFEYEVNTLFNSNGQSPFITIGFGLGTSWEARMVQKHLLLTRMRGLGAGKHTAIFPKLVFVLKQGLNMKPGDVNYDIKQLAMKCTSERMYPDYISYEKLVEVTGDYKVSMGCRSFLSAIESGETSGRNNLGVVSINLPRIAMESDGDFDEFFVILGERLRLAALAQKWRIAHLANVQAKSAPILYMYGGFGLRLDPEEYVLEHLRGRASISMGYIGCHEMLQVMYGEDVDTLAPECVSFVQDVLEVMSTYCEELRNETGFGFSLYATPSESLCDRFNRIDREVFPEYHWLFEKGYYTNSHHLSVDRKVAPDVKFDFESNFTSIASGGCISYVELPDMKKFPQGLEWVIDYAASKVHYFGINTPVDSCDDCGFMGETVPTENGFTCPSCGNHDPDKLEITRRVCGYLGNPGSRPFNPGKQHEVMDRVKHADVRKGKVQVKK